MRRLIAAAIVLTAATANAQQQFPAELAGHAIIPALSFVPIPGDAPPNLRVSGKYTGPGNLRTDRIGSLEGRSGFGPNARPTGISTPMRGQPLQGFSGIRHVGNGVFVSTADNGFGTQRNSPDHMLMVHRLRPNWRTGRVDRLGTVFLHDPDRRLPFNIVNEATARRYLTGSDLDPESIHIIGNDMYFGDEFGPFLIRADRNGRITGFWQTEFRGQTLRSPDHPSVSMPRQPDLRTEFQIGRSRGFEGLSGTPDGARLLALLEGAIWRGDGSGFENQDGRPFLRFLEFDVRAGRWSGRSFRYLLEANDHAIGDFTMIDADRGLVVERDNGEGDPQQACPAGQRAPTCFEAPARFKRVYVISFENVADDGFVRKLGYIDLMDIADPNRRARQGGRDGRFTFPFITIENIDRVDATHIIVANDNNLPFSAGRAANRADDNEFILLRVPELLNAR